MKLAKARELLHMYRHIDDGLCIEDVNEALELGIEALKRLQEIRVWHPAGTSHPLPGETLENER